MVAGPILGDELLTNNVERSTRVHVIVDAVPVAAAVAVAPRDGTVGSDTRMLATEGGGARNGDHPLRGYHVYVHVDLRFEVRSLVLQDALVVLSNRRTRLLELGFQFGAL